jgi:C4-type Zn-finger protein
MMGNRKQPFGYKMELGEIVIQPQEANVVRHIFQQYIRGISYQGLIAELKEQSVPYDEKKTWNKNMVARILEDRRYQGEQGFPAIIEPEVMNAAMRMRSTKQRPSQKTAAQKVMRQLSGCPPTKRTEQAVLGAINHLAANPTLIRVNHADRSDTEVTRLRRELDDVMEQQPIDEDAAKNLIFAIAAAQYSTIGSEEYETERLRRVFTSVDHMKELDADILRSTVSSIQVHGSGEVTIRLKNGQVIDRR